MQFTIGGTADAQLSLGLLALLASGLEGEKPHDVLALNGSTIAEVRHASRYAPWVTKDASRHEQPPSWKPGQGDGGCQPATEWN